MANELSIPTGNLPAHLQAHAAQLQQTEEFSGGVQSGPNLPSLSIRGKEFRFRWQGQERSTRLRDLDVILVAARPHMSRRFFLKKYEAGSVEAPDCASTDGQKPDQGVSAPQCATCGSCPHNQFGSRITNSGKQGKACNDYKRVVVLPVLNGQPLDQPVILDVPATSLKAPKGYRGNDLFWREYVGQLSKHQIQPTMVLTRISFTDAEYPQMGFAFNRYVSEEEFALVQKWRDHEDVKQALKEAATEEPGPITPAAPAIATDTPVPAPAPQPTLAPQPTPAPQPEPPAPAASNDVMADVASFLQSSGQGAPQPTITPPQAAGSVFEQAAPQPEAAQNPAPAAQPAAAGGDIMDEVSKLLGGL